MDWQDVYSLLCEKQATRWLRDRIKALRDGVLWLCLTALHNTVSLDSPTEDPLMEKKFLSLNKFS